MAASGSRVPELDLLRFTAAASVLIYHFGDIVHPHTGADRVFLLAGQFGFLGVPLFFMISGFVICWTAFKKSPGSFVIARACRLYPTYWVCVLVTSAMLAIEGDRLSASTIAANLSMIAPQLGRPYVDEVYWTLFVELKFYALVYILLLCRQRARIERWLALWLFGAAVALTAESLGGIRLAGLEFLVLDGYAAQFAFGCYGYLIREHGPSRARWIGLAASGVLGLLFELRFQFGYTRAFDLHTLLAVGGIMLALELIFALMAARRWALPVSPFWYWLGSLTYPLYLLHSRAGKTLYAMLPAALGQWERIGIALSGVFALTVALAVGIEQHGCQALYRLVTGIPRRTAAAPVTLDLAPGMPDANRSEITMHPRVTH